MTLFERQVSSIYFKSNEILQQYALPNVTSTGKVLGNGSYGCVIEVTSGNLLCAAKKLHEHLFNLNSEEVKPLVEKYVQECHIMASLRHPNIAQFLGICYCPDTNLPLIVMEKLDMSLDDLLEYVPNLPLTLKISFLEDISRGLDYLHKRKPPIVHRDLTARNVLLTSSLNAKISDMGNSHIISLKPGQIAKTLSQQPGTLVYMAPEALTDEHRYGPPLDIFSFGHLALFTLIQLFPGKLQPYTYRNSSSGRLEGRTEVERRASYIENLKACTSYHSKTLVELVKKCLDDSPEERPSSDDLLQQICAIRVKIDKSYCGSALKIFDYGRVQLAKEMKRNQEKMEWEIERQIGEKNHEIKVLQCEIEKLHIQTKHYKHKLQVQTEELNHQREEMKQQKEELQQLREKDKHQFKQEIIDTKKVTDHDNEGSYDSDEILRSLLKCLVRVQRKNEEMELMIVNAQKADDISKIELEKTIADQRTEIVNLKEHADKAHYQVQCEKAELDRKLGEIQHLHEVMVQLKEEKEHMMKEIERRTEEIQICDRREMEHKDAEIRKLYEVFHEDQQRRENMELMIKDLQESLSNFQSIHERVQVETSKSLKGLQLCKELSHCQMEVKKIEFPLKLKWTCGPDMPSGMDEYIQAVIMEETVYIGGKCPVGKSVILTYNTVSCEWNTFPRYPMKLFAMVVMENHLTLVGGETKKGVATGKVSCWDDSNCKWTCPYLPMNTARSGPSAVVHNQWLIVAGGNFGDCKLSTVEVLDATSRQWYYGPSTPTPWSKMKSIVLKESWYLMGGLAGEEGSATDITYTISLPKLISLSTTCSSSHHDNPWKIISGLRCHYSTPLALGGRLTAVGGLSDINGVSVSSINAYNLASSEEWVDVGQLPCAMHNCSCIFTSDKKILIFGGHELSKSFYIGSVS